ncbi:DMT family transporter [Phreatobacter sp. AB_2022a]|uniref:DMT family transporter n=1 Tax=Phreatobacter sp. AB_2022a TaxID=3003134 RepID=UPI00228760E8|nr:DMT family transporter [Phreatobacter sp. AB_2022a]MCZ0735085.1 DMT family transporter [Phreatobacter sp. AB_2022a]
MPSFVQAVPVIFVLIWSTGWVVAGFAARYADPLWFLFLRFLLAAAVIAAIAVATRAVWPRSPRALGHALASGIFLHTFYLCGVWWAVRNGVPTGISGIMAGLQPVFTALLAPLFLGERIAPRQGLGIALGFAGIVLVLAPKLLGIDPAHLATVLVPLGVNVLAMLAVTLGSFYQKRFIAGGDLRTTTALQYVGAALSTLPLVFLFGAPDAQWNQTLVLTMAWSVLALSVGGVGLFLYLIGRGEVSRAAAYIYLVPPVSALMSYVVFGEWLAPVQLVGMAVTALGVWLAVRRA